MRIYVGSLNFDATEADVRALFEQYGKVEQVEIVRAEGIGSRSRGFSFITMPDHHEAMKAIESLDTTLFMDRVLHVSRALPRRERPNNERRQMPHWGR
ncbi:MAG: RNA-binding protein [Acidobacteriota bacterium]